MLNPKYKPLVIGIITLGCLDAMGLFAMIVNPDLTERIIPALVGLQLIGFVAIAIVYVIRVQSKLETERLPSVLADLSTRSEKERKPRWRRTRWLWFAVAVLGILQTPTAAINALHTTNLDHRLIPVMVLAFAIRCGMIWFFLRLWWQFRSTN